MGKLLATVTLIFTIGAFVLPLLLMLSASRSISSLYLLKINTTNLTLTDAVLDSLPNGIGAQVSDTLDRLGLDNETDAFIASVAHELGLKSEYTAHLYGICTKDTPADGWRCEAEAPPYEFDPIPVLETDLVPGFRLEDIDFPVQQVRDGVDILRTVYKVMGILVLVSVILSGLSVVLGLAAVFLGRKTSALLAVIMWLSAACLIVAAVMATVMATKGKDVVNKEAGERIGVYADNSRDFLGVLWGGVGGRPVGGARVEFGVLL